MADKPPAGKKRVKLINQIVLNPDVDPDDTSQENYSFEETQPSRTKMSAATKKRVKLMQNWLYRINDT